MVSKLTEHPETAQLQQNRLFAGLPADLLSEIGSDLDLLRFDRDDVIFNEGEAGDCLYLVCEGSIRISKLGRADKQETLGYMQPGNFFGEMALIDGQPRSAQATAVESSVLGRVDAQTFERILERAPRNLHMNFLRSVTERLRGVNSHYIDELMRTERLSLVGTMANSIIHDLKNPIQAIRGCAEFIRLKAEEPAITNFVNIIDRAVDNMLDMTQELLDFARGRTSLQLARCSTGAVVSELDSQVGHLIPKNVCFIREIECFTEIEADIGRFARMLLNLIKNSVEAMPHGGILRLTLRQDGGRILFGVADTGSGIDPELQAKIFEPFVTYGKSKGTGLGMAIVKSVVEAHHGTITLTSKVGLGTTVEVALPQVTET